MPQRPALRLGWSVVHVDRVVERPDLRQRGIDLDIRARGPAVSLRLEFLAAARAARRVLRWQRRRAGYAAFADAAAATSATASAVMLTTRRTVALGFST
ncbi:MAG: hypothetical protein U1F25_00405 [Rubrivivax sp.]